LQTFVVFHFFTSQTGRGKPTTYVSNSDAMLPKSLHLIALGVVVVLSPGDAASTISFYGYYKVLVQDVAKVSTVMLFTGLWDVDALTRVLRVCNWFVKLPMSSFDLPATGVPRENSADVQ